MIGFTSFGGMSMIPLINDQMLTHGWMTSQEVADIVAIAEMTPGPLGAELRNLCRDTHGRDTGCVGSFPGRDHAISDCDHAGGHVSGKIQGKPSDG